jgi:hypothetical protein
MNETKVLLNAYYEMLYELLDAKKSLCRSLIERLLSVEIEKQGFAVTNQERFDAYLDAADAFVIERIETYNPVGVQYAFDPISPRETWEIETQLNWYDSRAEFEELAQTARELVNHHSDTPKTIRQSALNLIKLVGAFPNKSIITGYLTAPALQKLPDYLVACAIEVIIQQQL